MRRIYELTGSGTWADVAGVVGLVLCAVALYAALALALEDARSTTTLPVGRVGSTGPEDRLEREAGVRRQL